MGTSQHRRALVRATLVLAFFSPSCGEREEERSIESPPVEAQPASLEAVDAGADASHDAGPPRPPARLFAKRFVTKIRERPDRDSFRVGYLRAGAVVMATTADPVRTDDPRCPGGWYELTTGGFVCNGRDVIAFHGRRLPQARGAQPDRAAPMPYAYGRNRRDSTPMYRRLPTDEEAAEFEGFRIPGQEPAEGAEAPAEGGGATTGEGGTAAPEAGPPPSPASAPSPARTRTASPAADAEGEPVEEGDVPVTLASLQGDPNSALMRRLVRGFIVSLDRDFRAGRYGRRYWRTINNGFVPYGALAPVSSPDFQGVRLDDVTRLPIGYILGRNEVFFTRTPDGRARRGRPLDFHHRLTIVGEEEIGGTRYYVGADGRLYREGSVRRIVPRERPAGVGANDKWIEVNLSGQYLIAYEGDRPVYATLISSGRAYHPGDPEANYLTPTGLFRIRAKHLAATMDGDTAADGPYSIDDVPWVMYFQLAYALHGAFWHNAFGYPRSHGCVNLAPRDAQWVFNWSDPQLPDGWHGVYPTESEPGTWIYIHGETPGARR
ncbi:MAG TPA: L,D-transpeptidase [Sandaracinaceae bacterium]